MTAYDFVMSFLGALGPFFLLGILGLILLVVDLIKWLRTKDVNPTSGYYGDWFISRKEAMSRKTFNNNGLACVVIPFDKFQKFVRGRDEREMW